MKESQSAGLYKREQPGRGSSGGSVRMGTLDRGSSNYDPAFSALFDSSAEALIVIDSLGVIQRANRAASDLLRLRDGTSRRSGLHEFLGESHSGEVAAFLAQAGHPGPKQRVDARLASGSPVRITLRTVLPGSHHLVLCLEERSGAGRQIPAQIRTDIRSKMLQTEKMAALGQLVSGIAHELNNPLTAIMGYAQLLLGRGLAQPQLSEANKVFQEAERARHIVKNLLYFARENKPERTRVHLNEIVERTLALRSYELKVENIVVECDLQPDLPETMADPHQLQQVVLNLLINSEQALLEGRGQGRISMRTRLVDGRRIRLEISDDGPGIAPDIASRIFDPFFTTKPPGVGTGLGLSIVYGIVQQHDGEVTFESRRSAGAKFVVEIPLVAGPAENGASTPSSRPGSEQTPSPTGRVLVVEDEPSVAQLIADVLREEGHRVDPVLDSREGLTRLSRGRYDIVICDLRMPRLDGPAFYDALVRTASPLQHRILFITGDTLAPRTQQFLESHRVPYLAKPFLVEELKLAVHRLLVAASPPSPVTPNLRQHHDQTVDSRN